MNTDLIRVPYPAVASMEAVPVKGAPGLESACRLVFALQKMMRTICLLEDDRDFIYLSPMAVRNSGVLSQSSGVCGRSISKELDLDTHGDGCEVAQLCSAHHDVLGRIRVR